MANEHDERGTDEEYRSAAKRFVTANGQEMRHYGRKGVKFGEGGKIGALKFEVTNVMKPLAARRRIVENGEVHFGNESFIRNTATGDAIPMRRKRGSYVIDVNLLVSTGQRLTGPAM